MELTVRSTLSTVPLHGHMGVEVVQSAISLFAPVVATFIHALDFFVPPSRPLVLLCPRNGDKAIDL